MKAATFFYALALLLLPFSYAIKSMLLVFNIPWIDPGLILGLIAFVLTKARMPDRRAFWIIGWAFVAAFIGSFFLAVTEHTVDRPRSPLYILYVEPLKLSLNIIWYWVSIKFITEKRDFVIRWLAISVAIQFSIATYLCSTLYDLTPVPDTVALYLSLYRQRQTLWWGDMPIFRMAGTFDESPPFGLFMFGCFVIFALWLATDANSLKRHRKWAIFGAIVSGVGGFASLSDQIIVAFIIFGVFWYSALRRRFGTRSGLYSIGEAILGVGLLLGISGYTISRLVAKWQEAASYQATKTTDVMGTSGAERAFHLRYGLEILGEFPLTIWTGIGPGRYGDYAYRTGLFAPTVTIQNTPLNWLVEYGLVGTGLICAWLWNIHRVSRRAYGGLATAAMIALLLANLSQGNWLWEAWFLALAFLYSAGESSSPLESELKAPRMLDLAAS
jgi:hypothetical protein